MNNVQKSKDDSPDAEVPFGIPESFSEHINLLWDLQILAFRADITRVSMLMYAHDVSMRVYPERMIERAVYGMLPKSALGRQTLRRKLRVYATANHPHVAQQPAVLTFNRTNETK